MEKKAWTNQILLVTIVTCIIVSMAFHSFLWVSVLFSFIVLITALVSFALAFIFGGKSKQRYVMLYFSSCSLLIGLWFLMNTAEGPAIVGGSSIAEIIATVSEAILIPLFCIFVRQVQKENWGQFARDKALDKGIFIFLLCVPLAAFLQWRWSYSLLASWPLEVLILLILIVSGNRLEETIDGELKSMLASGLTMVMLLVAVLKLADYVGMVSLETSHLYAVIATTVILNASWIIFMRQNYLRLEENTIIQEQLTQSRMQLMLSQIQPHFIYNALNSIHIMIRKDPDVACNMITNFSDYLRANMEAMGNRALISIKEELAHVKAYVEIEKIRFPKIDVIYEIDEWNFFIPVLTVEPLVENAIKHGVAKTRDGGVVNIRVYKSRGYIYIEVKDNGQGFDTSIMDNENKSIGIRNVKYRLKKMMDGTLNITSNPGVGTVAQIKLPIHMAEGDKNNENNFG